MAACCPPDSLGAAPLCIEHSVGCLETIEDETAKALPCYVTGSSWNETTRVILVFTDIFGIDAGLHKEVADRLATALGKTTTVIIPDFFRVTDVALDHDLLKILMPWIRKKSENPGVEVSCVGFCFGGWLATHTLALSELGLLPVKCAIGLHPSFGVEGIYGRNEDDFARATGSRPLLLLPAGNDSLKPGNTTVKIMADARSITLGGISSHAPRMGGSW
jgi:dienelactone hydrolase